MSDFPQSYMLVSGIGKAEYPLVTFDNALRDAGIGDYNLVKVSSILPPKCIRKNVIDIKQGSIFMLLQRLRIQKRHLLRKW